MSVLIEGLKMPKRMPIQALIFPDGRVFVKLHSGKMLDCIATPDRKSTRLNSSHTDSSRMPSSA